MHEAQKNSGPDPRFKHNLCVTYIPRRSKELLAKDPFQLVDVISHSVARGGDKIALNIVGWGAGMDDLKEQVRAASLENKVRFFGRGRTRVASATLLSVRPCLCAI